MEILKRSRGHSDGEILSFNHNQKDIREEVNRRTHNAGYTDRDGQPRISPEIVSKPPNEQYRENYEKIKW